jgi:hypothetical protein
VWMHQQFHQDHEDALWTDFHKERTQKIIDSVEKLASPEGRSLRVRHSIGRMGNCPTQPLLQRVAFSIIGFFGTRRVSEKIKKDQVAEMLSVAKEIAGKREKKTGYQTFIDKLKKQIPV